MGQDLDHNASISITMHQNDGEITDAELIRHKSWIRSVGMEADKCLPMMIENRQVHGSAIVTSIDEYPLIAKGKGSVVTAKFLESEVNVNVRAEILGADGVGDGTIERAANRSPNYAMISARLCRRPR